MIYRIKSKIFFIIVLITILISNCSRTAKVEMYTVSFSIKNNNGRIQAEVNGSNIRPQTKVLKGEVVIIKATAESGYAVDKWSISGSKIISGGKDGDAKVTIKITADTVVIVEFKKIPEESSPKPKYQVIFSTDGGNGSLTASVDEKNITSPAQIEKGKKIIFTAQPASGYMVEHWTGITAVSQNAVKIEHTVVDNLNILVKFKPIPSEKYTVTVERSINGKLTVNPALPTDKKIGKGTELNFKAKPNEGYAVDKWSISGSKIISGGKDGDAEVTIKITADTVVKVVFKKKDIAVQKHQIQFKNANYGGTVKAFVDGQEIRSGISIEQGKQITFKTIAENDYEVEKWDGLNANPVNANEVTVTVLAPLNVTVTFKQKAIPVTKITLTDLDGNSIGSDKKLVLDSQLQLVPVIEPVNATDKTIIYEVSGQSVSVTKNGLVTARKSGISTVNVKASNNKHTSVTFNVPRDNTITFHTTKIETDHNASVKTFSITKKYTGSEYALTVEPNANWLEYENKGGNTKEEVFTLHISENKSSLEKKTAFVFRTTEIAKHKRKILQKIEILQKANPNSKLTTKWVHGITPPSDNELQHGGINVNPKYCTWPESQTTTWFNAKKLQNNSDDQMCWAMSTADLIHWWMVENEESLKKLVEKKNIQPNTEEYELHIGNYNRNIQERKSSVANVFRERFINSPEGTALNTAVGWYLMGRETKGQKPSNTKPAPGIVKDIFSNLTDLIVPSYAHNKQDFENTIKDALNQNNALAVQFTLNSGLHVVTVWGVEFDEGENIVALWVSDSNDGYSRLTKFGVHYPNGVPCKINFAALNDKGTTRITDVITMKNGKNKFADWLNQHNP